MTSRMKKYGVLIITAVLLVAMAFAGAASADVTKYNSNQWNDLGSAPTSGSYLITNGNAKIDPKNLSSSNQFTLTGDLTLDFSGYTTGFVGVSFDSDGKVGALLGNVNLNDHTLKIIGLNMTTVNVTSSGGYDGSIGGIIGNVAGSGTLNFTNCHLVNCSISITTSGSGSRNVGGLVGYADTANFVRGNVTNSTIASTGSNYVGGLVGYAKSASFDSCGVENASVYACGNGDEGYVGGLVGCAESAVNKIKDCVVKNCVIASDSGGVGGLVGCADSSANGIGNCHVVNCTVSGSYSVGGLVGCAISASGWSGNFVTNCAINATSTNYDSIYTNYVCGNKGELENPENCSVTGNNFIRNTSQSQADTTITPTLSYGWNTIQHVIANGTTKVTNIGTYGEKGGYGVGSYEPSEPGPTSATYVEVSDWDQLVANVSGWTDQTTMRTIVLTNDDEGAYKNTIGTAGGYGGISVTGLLTITPAAGIGEITIDANGMGRLFDVDGGMLTLIGNGTSATLNLTGAYIGDNGGGIIIHNVGTITLNTGVNITNCTSGVNGGGVCVEEGTFNMSGGSITDCSAEYGGVGGGGGVLVLSEGTFNVNGTATITGNTHSSQTSNVLLADSSRLSLLAGGFTGNIGLSVYSSTSAVGETFGVAASDATGAGKFFADDNATLIGSISSGKLVWAEKPITYVEVNSWAGLNKSIAEWTDTTEARTVAVNASIMDRVAGNNTDGINVYGKIILTTNASPVDNKAVIDGKGLGRLFKIMEGGDLTLRGNVSTILNLTGGNANIDGIIGDRYGGAVLAEAGNLTFAGYGAKIYNCSAENGGGVFVNTSYTFTMYGGSISNCKSSNGGGVFIKARSNFTMKDGSITKCVASGGGGVYAVGAITMTGGRITENTATGGDSDNGGGVVVTSGKFNVSGSAIISNNNRNGITSNVAIDADKLTLDGSFTGSIGIVQMNTEHKAGVQFGLAPVTYSGAEYFVSDANANLVGSISDGKLVWKNKNAGSSSGSSSTHQSGYTQIVQNVPTTTPTAAPTAAPTPATPTAKPTTQATTQPTQSSPAPVAGLIAGLGAAALVLTRLRK